jgi:DNA-directed RNA polymerase subunit RPC12/RpoP
LVQTRKLEIACPLCGSRDVVYSCTPACCFNHVCASCGGTFEPATTIQGGKLAGIVPPEPLPDCTEATAGCARCESTAVYMTPDDAVVCAACGSLLELELTAIAPA